VLAALVRRARFQVLVIPYALDAFPEVAFAICRRRGDGDGCWHAMTGHAEHRETPLQAARRHACEHAGVGATAAYLALDSRPAIGPALPEHAFGVRVDPAQLTTPAGHEHLWVSYKVAHGLLARDAERNAIWELRQRIGRPRTCR
jgi:8-oxo-dGTP pyrophosphatase MutT (NUDIX family)